MSSDRWYKNEPSDKVWWLDTDDIIGEFIFSFDQKKKFNLFADYPAKLTPMERQIFDADNPFWKEFFKDRK